MTTISHKQGALRIFFFTLSMLSGFFELGSAVFLLYQGQNIQMILLAGFCYQLGNLAASTTKLSKKSTIIVAIGSSMAFATYGYSNFLICYFLGITLISVAIQKVRRLITEEYGSEGISTFSKRATRIIGFLASGLVSLPLLIFGNLIIFVIIMVIATVVNGNWLDLPKLSLPKRNSISDIMVIHQSHYFSYAYWIPVLFVYQLGVRIPLVGAFFIIGWLSYIFTEKLFSRYNTLVVFVIGHFSVALALFVIGTFQNSVLLVATAWFLSGLGGGSVYCLKRVNKKMGIDQVDLEIWEDIGHVTGAIIPIILIGLLGEKYNSFYISAIIAICTALLMLSRVRIIYTKGRQSHQINIF